MNLILWFYMLMFMISIFMFSYYFKHLFLTMMMMEFIMLNLLMFMFNLMMNNSNLMEILYYLTMVVSESCLMLTLMIVMVRMCGNDKSKFLNLILW